MKTREEVEDLWRQYLADPVFEVWSVEGFEEYWVELNYRADIQEKKWQDESLKRKKDRAAKIGGTVELIEHIERLEYQIQSLREKVERLEMAYEY